MEKYVEKLIKLDGLKIIIVGDIQSCTECPVYSSLCRDCRITNTPILVDDCGRQIGKIPSNCPIIELHVGKDVEAFSIEGDYKSED